MENSNDSMPLSERGHNWRCIFCTSKKNLMDWNKCGICGNLRQPNRIAVQHSSGLYLCKTNTMFKIPTMTIYRLAPLPEIQFKAIIPAVGSSLRDSLCEVLDTAMEDKAHVLGSKEDFIFSGDITSDLRSVHSAERNLDERVDDSFIENRSDGLLLAENRNQSDLNPETASIASSDTSLRSSRRETCQSPFEAATHRLSHGQASPDRKLSLYDTIIDKAHNLAYDGSVGRFIDIKSIETILEKQIQANQPQNASNLEESTPINIIDKYKTDLEYPKHMIISKKELELAVNEEIKHLSHLPSKHHPIDLSHQNINLNDPILKNQQKFSICYLCLLTFPKESLAGIVSLKSVLQWKANHDVEVNRRDKQYLKYTLVDGVPICVFCMQFFDDNYSFILEQMAKEEKIDEIFTESMISSMDVATSVSLKESSSKQSIDRPYSRLVQKISVTQLKIRSEISKSRFQIQKYNHRSRIVDTTKVGTFLRDKYKDDNVFTLMKRKSELQEILKQKRSSMPALHQRYGQSTARIAINTMDNIKNDSKLPPIRSKSAKYSYDRSNRRHGTNSSKDQANRATFLTETDETRSVDKPRFVQSSGLRHHSAASYTRSRMSTSTSSISSGRSSRISRRESELASPRRARSTDSRSRRPENQISNKTNKPRSYSANSSRKDRQNRWNMPSLYHQYKGTPKPSNRSNLMSSGLQQQDEQVKQDKMNRKKQKKVIQALKHDRKPLLLAVPDIVSRTGIRVVEFPSIHTSSYLNTDNNTNQELDNNLVVHEVRNMNQYEDIFDLGNVNAVTASAINSQANSPIFSLKNSIKESNCELNDDILLTEEVLCVTNDGQIAPNPQIVVMNDLVSPAIQLSKSKDNTTQKNEIIDIYKPIDGLDRQIDHQDIGNRLVVGSNTFWLSKPEISRHGSNQYDIEVIEDFDGSIEDFIRKYDTLDPAQDSSIDGRKSNHGSLYAMMVDRNEVKSRGTSRGASRGSNRATSSKKRRKPGETTNVGYIEVLDPPHRRDTRPISVDDMEDRSVTDESDFVGRDLV